MFLMNQNFLIYYVGFYGALIVVSGMLENQGFSLQRQLRIGTGCLMYTVSG